MAFATEAWPAAPIVVPQKFKQLIERFFIISESTDPDSGKTFAEELFTEDGFFKTHETCVFEGKAAIAASRQNNSPLITSNSRHITQVFVSNNPATDVVVIGSFTNGLINGSTLQMDFTARFQSVETEEGETKLRSVQFWTDPTAMIEAFKRLEGTTA